MARSLAISTNLNLHASKATQKLSKATIVILLLNVFVAANALTNGHVSGNQSTNQPPESSSLEAGRLSFWSAFKSLQGTSHKAPKCGHSMKFRNMRIVGGKRSHIGEFPWMVSLQREKGYWFGFKSYYHSCGGSLITPSWVVSAAHCFYGREGDPYRAVAGTDNINHLSNAQTRYISKVLVHPGFDDVLFNNDIALLKVDRPFNLESPFSPINAVCLDKKVPILPYDIATICGFGSKAFKSQTRTHLYKTDIAIIDDQICNKSFDYTISNTMICAGGMIDSKRDACSGDSGGPLMLDVDGRMSLIGVVSFGNDCAVKGFPGVYTKVASYYDWIVGHLDEGLLSP